MIDLLQIHYNHNHIYSTKYEFHVFKLGVIKYFFTINILFNFLLTKYVNY
jgi:hypothetical protein